jgi:hypothetical protein
MSQLIGVYSTLIARNAVFPPEQVCSNKCQFKASLSYQLHKGGKEKYVYEYFSFSKTSIM